MKKVKLISCIALLLFGFTSCSKKDKTEPQSYEIKITINPKEGGRVSRSADGPYKKGTSIALQAIPEDGYIFVKWEGDTSSTHPSLELVVSKNYTLTAVFAQKFYLARNGVTVKCPLAEIGESGKVNGVVYTKRNAADITPGNASTTCTSGITNMSSLFKDKSSFNEDISSWDVSDVTNMGIMFFGATAFNQDIGHWDVSSVKNMMFMFQNASSFNQDIGNWDVSHVKSFTQLFDGASSFNQDIGNWDVSSATALVRLFFHASSFNQDIGNWDVSNAKNMVQLFDGASSFNQDISGWDVSKVTDMRLMFNGATAFDQDLSGWCVEKITSEPAGFTNGGCPLTAAHKPVWGTCP